MSKKENEFVVLDFCSPTLCVLLRGPGPISQSIQLMAPEMPHRRAEFLSRQIARFSSGWLEPSDADDVASPKTTA